MPILQGQSPKGMDPELGPRLTQAEYEHRIVALHTSRSAMPSKVQDIATRRAELDLLIDYKLGTHLPPQRRDALWQEQVRLDRNFPWRLIISFVLNPTSPSSRMAKSQVRAFANVLSPQELSALLDLSTKDVARFLK